MKKILFLFFLSLVILKSNAQNIVEVSGQQFNKVITLDGEKLHFNGGGLREKYWIDLYIAALYTKEKTKDAMSVISSDEHTVIQLRIVSDKVTRDKFIETVKEGFEKASVGKASKEEIKKFTSFFSKEIKKGDKIYLEYIPNSGLQVKYNGDILGVIKSLEFKKALFSIWLGSNCVDPDLKSKLLGK